MLSDFSDEDVARGISQMAEPDNAEKRQILYQHLKNKGGILSKLTPKGQLEADIDKHQRDHLSCDEKCQIFVTLKEQSSKLTGALLEYQMIPKNDPKDVILWTTAVLRALEQQKLITLEFPIELAEDGVRRLQELLKQGWMPHEVEVKSVLRSIFTTMPEDTVDAIWLLARNASK